jgi:peroxiredoxin
MAVEAFEYYDTVGNGSPLVVLGDPAPQVTVEDAAGQPCRLADYWRRGPLVLIFIRQFGCMFCREHVTHLRRRYAEFQAAGAEVVVVGMGTPAATRAFIQAYQIPFPVLSDPLRRAYRAYGAMRGSLRQWALDPQVLARTVQTTLAGNISGPPVADPAQLSATFIVDRQGIIRFAVRAELSSDYAPADELLATLKTLRAVENRVVS